MNSPTTCEHRPTTLGGVKRLAKRIKRAQGITHNRSLNIAAAQSGFSDFDEARRKLAPSVDLNQGAR